MSPGSNTQSYPAFAHIGLKENPEKNLNQVTYPDRKSNLGHLVSRPDALTRREISRPASRKREDRAEHFGIVERDARASVAGAEVTPWKKRKQQREKENDAIKKMKIKMEAHFSHNREFVLKTTLAHMYSAPCRSEAKLLLRVGPPRVLVAEAIQPLDSELDSLTPQPQRRTIALIVHENSYCKDKGHGKYRGLGRTCHSLKMEMGKSHDETPRQHVGTDFYCVAPSHRKQESRQTKEEIG
ncbi:hypothetical protein ANN_15679 [Periplaneta americana]|uniref:Uncharacterized protein n=1 Tax=Periplaneta americana TaxID=6978 RepID=A0ABQ8SH07_PERAM|nr:hypothetical protein ANN_15679 [Periplaneta americana]